MGADIDAFEDLPYKWQGEGYNAGLAAGRRSGLVEGFHLGVQSAEDIARQLGIIAGRLYSCLVQRDALTDSTRRRIHKALTEILVYPTDNSEDVEKEARLNRIQAAYREVCSILGESPSLSNDGGFFEEHDEEILSGSLKKKLEF